MPKRKVIGKVNDPTTLSDRSLRIWRDLIPRRAKSPERRTMIQVALECLDRADQAREKIDADGLVFKTESTGTVHVHPLLKTEKDSRALFAKIWGQLGLTFFLDVDGMNAWGGDD